MMNWHFVYDFVCLSSPGQLSKTVYSQNETLYFYTLNNKQIDIVRRITF